MIEKLDTVVNFQIIDKDLVYDYTVNNLVSHISVVDSGDEDPQGDEEDSPIVSDEGFSQELYLHNNLLTDMMLMFAAVLLIVFLIIIICICRRTIMRGCIHPIPFLCKYFERKLVINSVLRALLESYLLAAFSVFIELKVQFVYNPIQNTSNDIQELSEINYLFSILILLVLLFQPLGSKIFLESNFSKLSEVDKKQRCGSLYPNVNYYSHAALNYTPMFLVRRFLFAWSIIFLPEYSLFAQVLSIDLLCMTMLAYFIVTLPMENGMHNFIQIFNEVFLIIALLFLYTFTNYTNEPRVKDGYGYAILYMVALQIGVNLMILILHIL